MGKEVFFRDPKSVAHRIRQLRGMKASFKMRQTNYTTVIEFPNGDKEHYLYTLRSRDVFVAHRKIGKEAIPNYVEADFEGHCKYFVLNSERVLDLRMRPQPVYNLDLRSAYPSVLRRFGLISDKTFDYLMRLDKNDRLAAIGMFAGRKTVFTVRDGELMNLEEVESEYKNVFFLPAYVVDEVMSDCMRVLGEDFIYYWFDGIYYTNQRRIRDLEGYLGQTGLHWKVHRLSKFKLVDRGEVVDVSFEEPGKGAKAFSLPRRDHILEGRRLIEMEF